MKSHNLFYKIENWYLSKDALPYWCVLLCDCAIVSVSLFVTHLLNSSPDMTWGSFLQIVLATLVYLVFYVVGFRLFHTYSGVIRYSSFIDLLRVVGAIAVGSVAVELVRIVVGKTGFLAAITFPELAWGSLLSVLLMMMVRVAIKVIYDYKFISNDAPNVMIFGAKTGGVGLAKSIASQNPSPYKVRAFISISQDMSGHTLMNKPVYYAQDAKLKDLIKENRIKVIIVSPIAYDYFISECQDLISFFIHSNIKIRMIQSEVEWDGKSDLNHAMLKDVEVEDLLPRKKIEVDMNAIGEMLKGKRILITGAAGSIGFEMVKQVAKFSPAQMVLIDQAETPMHDVRLYMSRRYPDVQASTIVGSISNQTHMERIFADNMPEYVFHAAAYKHVPMMEDNPSMAVQNNIYGTRVIADLAVKYGTKKFVMISTDKAVNPTNVMGCSKRICEIYCQALNKSVEEGERFMHDGRPAVTQFVTTRFGNVLGSNGSVIPIFKEQILKGGPVTVTHPDIIRFFMLIPEACRLVLEAGTMGKGGEIFVFDMGSPVRIADLAQRMIDMMGARGVEIKYTGLRDGEKLYEEVLNDEEQTKPTIHPKIKIAAVREYPYSDALANEEELYKLSFSYDDMAVVAKMKQIVPEYKSQHSKYSILD